MTAFFNGPWMWVVFIVLGAIVLYKIVPHLFRLGSGPGGVTGQPKPPVDPTGNMTGSKPRPPAPPPKDQV